MNFCNPVEDYSRCAALFAMKSHNNIDGTTKTLATGKQRFPIPSVRNENEIVSMTYRKPKNDVRYAAMLL